MVLSLPNGVRNRSNLNSVQFGNKLSGLPPSSAGGNRRVILRRTRACGSGPTACGNPQDRIKIYYGNRVGGIGMRIPTAQKYKCACTHPIYSKNPYLP